jgi:hypothetical protein
LNASENKKDIYEVILSDDDFFEQNEKATSSFNKRKLAAVLNEDDSSIASKESEYRSSETLGRIIKKWSIKECMY